MTNSQRTDKRERLVAGATELLHRQGVGRTTLADIASAADVPLGNVYYYYKTRDELVGSVIDHWQSLLRQRLKSLEERRTPKARLKALAELWTTDAESMAQDGCPVGGLCYELNKGHDTLALHAREMLETIVSWAETQIRALGCRDPHGLAVHLLAGIQGATLLANTFDDAALLRAEVRRLERWIDALA
jgi:TetR/AcrR family transcriptional regulator, transcriptional repressor for nem operon